MIMLFSKLMNCRAKDSDGGLQQITDASIDKDNWKIESLGVSCATESRTRWISVKSAHLKFRYLRTTELLLDSAIEVRPCFRSPLTLAHRISAKDLYDSKICIELNEPALSLDFLFNSQNWGLLYVIAHPIQKRSRPLIIPLTSITGTDFDPNILTSSISHEVLLRSPCFVPGSFGLWEHQVLTQFYSRYLYAK